MSHYGLFKRERGWQVERVLVVSPYVEQSFFTTLVNRLHPETFARCG